jgi:hypothetical protein
MRVYVRLAEETAVVGNVLTREAEDRAQPSTLVVE